MPEELLPSTEFEENLTQIIKKHGTQEFAEARKWLTKCGIQNVEDYLIKKIAETLSSNFSNGLLQLTVEGITETKEYANATRRGDHEVILALNTSLPPLTAYVEFVVTYGAIEAAVIRCEFKLYSTVNARDIRIIIEGNSINQVLFGTLAVSVRLTILVNAIEVNVGTIEKQLKVPYRLNLRPPQKTLAPRTSAAPQEAVLVKPETRFCDKCGSQIEPAANFCRKCGARQLSS